MTYEEFIEAGGSGNEFMDILYDTFRNRDTPYCYEGAGWPVRWFVRWWCRRKHRHKFDYQATFDQHQRGRNKLEGKINRYAEVQR